jgi:hypothetical protein
MPYHRRVSETRCCLKGNAGGEGQRRGGDLCKTRSGFRCADRLGVERMEPGATSGLRPALCVGMSGQPPQVVLHVQVLDVTIQPIVTSIYHRLASYVAEPEFRCLARPCVDQVLVLVRYGNACVLSAVCSL